MSLGPVVRRLLFSGWQSSSSFTSPSAGRFLWRLPITSSDNNAGAPTTSTTNRGLFGRKQFSTKLEVGQSSLVSPIGHLISSQILSSQPSRMYHIGASSTLLAPTPRCLDILTACNPLERRSLPLTSPLLLNITRSVTKFSMMKGRRKTQKTAVKRFFRLDWGGWISAKPGRARHLWKQPIAKKNRLRRHIFRSATECRMLDKMVTKYWIKKKYFVDDPYESYHTRDNFRITKGVKGVDSTKLRRIKMYYPKNQ